MCVCVCVCAAGEEIEIQDALADIMSLNDWVNFFANDNNDSNFEGFYANIWSRLTQWAYICLRNELHGQKLALTYLPGRLIREYIRYASLA